jgi:nucleoside 2-deoxyribosyltransferase
MNPSVYIAGPITGLSYQGSTDWRKLAYTALSRSEITVYSPMRNLDFLAHMKQMPDAYEHNALSAAKGIVAQDRFDVMRADLVYANLLGAERVSIGTVIELAWAHAFNTPVLISMEPEGNPHDHAFIKEIAGWIVPSIEEAISTIRHILLPSLTVESSVLL